MPRRLQMSLPLRSIALAAALAAGPAAGQEATLEVHVQDADAFDWIVVRNAGGCDAVSGRLRIDFGPSEGGVMIDTEYGGGGALHPRPVEVLDGPAEVLPVEDGAREVDIRLFGLGPDAQAVLILDIDSQRDGPGSASIVASPGDIAGSLAVFAAREGAAPARAVFGGEGTAVLTVPCVPPGLVMGEGTDIAVS